MPDGFDSGWRGGESFEGLLDVWSFLGQRDGLVECLCGLGYMNIHMILHVSLTSNHKAFV